MTSKQLKDLKQVHEIQGNHGNWDYDPYMQGMYNGLELALAIVEDREPDFRGAPSQWLSEPVDEASTLQTLPPLTFETEPPQDKENESET